MEKSFKNFSVISRSEAYFEDKCRGFARKADRNSHHSKRNNNRNADEMTFQHGAVKRTFKIPAKSSNVPNDYHLNFKDHNNYRHDIKKEILELVNYHTKLSPEENIDLYFETAESEKERLKKSRVRYGSSFHFLRATRKQLQRRGKAERFCGYNKERDCKTEEEQS